MDHEPLPTREHDLHAVTGRPRAVRQHPHRRKRDRRVVGTRPDASGASSSPTATPSAPAVARTRPASRRSSLTSAPPPPPSVAESAPWPSTPRPAASRITRPASTRCSSNARDQAGLRRTLTSRLRRGAQREGQALHLDQDGRRDPRQDATVRSPPSTGACPMIRLLPEITYTGTSRYRQTDWLNYDAKRSRPTRCRPSRRTQCDSSMAPCRRGPLFASLRRHWESRRSIREEPRIDRTSDKTNRRQRSVRG